MLKDCELRRPGTHPADLDRTRAESPAQGHQRAGFRDHVLYGMSLGTGLREHELISLEIGDVFRDGKPRRRLLLRVFKGAGKAVDLQ